MEYHTYKSLRPIFFPFTIFITTVQSEHPDSMLYKKCLVGNSDPVIKCSEAKDVCWLSHEHAVKAILHTLPSLITSLDREALERSEPTAQRLLKFICTYEFVACISAVRCASTLESTICLISDKRYQSHNATNVHHCYYGSYQKLRSTARSTAQSTARTTPK